MNQWLRDNVTFSTVMALLALFASGITYINQVRSLEIRVVALEAAVWPTREQSARQDEVLKSIQAQLAEIKGDLKDIKRQEMAR